MTMVPKMDLAIPVRRNPLISSSLMGSLAKGLLPRVCRKFCGKFAAILRKVRGNLRKRLLYCGRKGADILRKVAAENFLQ